MKQNDYRLHAKIPGLNTQTIYNIKDVPNKNVGYYEMFTTTNQRLDTAAKAMETAVDPYRPNPIVNPISRTNNPYILRMYNKAKVSETIS